MTQETWRFLDLKEIEPVSTQAVYEAVAMARKSGIVPDTLIICWPSSPLACIGYFQEVEKELDLEYCREKGIPVVRRILGGGAVYLDSGQLFYQIIGKRGGRVIPGGVEAIFQKMLEAPIRTYREIGIPVVYKPINDIEVEGRKISGNGAGEIDDVAILTGNLILDFDYDEMTRILRVPNEKFRDKLTRSLRDRLTTIKRELGTIPKRQDLEELLLKHFRQALGIEFTREPLTKEEDSILKELIRDKYLSRKWIYENSSRHKELSQPRVVKISGRSIVGQGMLKSIGGLIRVTGEFVEGRISDVLLSGDFTFLPPKIPELERILANIELDEQTLTRLIQKFYEQHRIASPGTTPSDFARAILIAGGVCSQ